PPRENRLLALRPMAAEEFSLPGWRDLLLRERRTSFAADWSAGGGRARVCIWTIRRQDPTCWRSFRTRPMARLLRGNVAVTSRHWTTWCCSSGSEREEWGERTGYKLLWGRRPSRPDFRSRWRASRPTRSA